MEETDQVEEDVAGSADLSERWPEALQRSVEALHVVVEKALAVHGSLAAAEVAGRMEQSDWSIVGQSHSPVVDVADPGIPSATVWQVWLVLAFVLPPRPLYLV